MHAHKTGRVVIVGAGFGGLFAARALDRADIEVVVVDRHNYHLFQPLLYQVATAALAPSDIAWPIRSLLGHQRNTRVLMAEVQGIDQQAQEVILGDRRLGYDYLILATGSQNWFFGHEHWPGLTLGIKDLNDATRLRRHILKAMERAEMEPNPQARKKLLTFVVIGGGPTGIEIAGSIAELGAVALDSDFPSLKAEDLKVVLLEAAAQLLGGLQESLGQYTVKALSELSVEVKTGCPVVDISAHGVQLAEGSIEAATVIWAAGVCATPVADWLDVKADRGGRVPVDGWQQPVGMHNVFVVGDAAAVEGAEGRCLPGIAPVAKQQGRFVGRLIRSRLQHDPDPPAFKYRDYGLLATIGRGRGVADFGRLRFRGWLAWWLWGLIHIYFLIGRRSRLLVALKWLWEYVTLQRGSRLIIDADESARDD
jgi:NADH dehydrogenase